jgi:hypothetical protein
VNRLMLVPASGSTTQQPAGNLQRQETCSGNNNSIWTGTLTFSYASGNQRHGGSGLGSHGVPACYPGMTGGYRDLTLTQ